MDNILTIKNIFKKFKKNEALKNINICISKGVVHGLIGPDGAGKTTLMRISAGIMTPSSGAVSINNVNSTDHSQYFSQFGYMPQTYGLYLDLTAWENLLFFANLHGLNAVEAKKRAAKFLDFTRLSPFKDRLAGQLSGGMYKKLALCTVLMHNPTCLILDEPTIGVDPISRRDLWELIFELASDGTAIFISTPYMDEAERCHEITIISDGDLIFQGNPNSAVEKFVLKNPAIDKNNIKFEEVFLELTHRETR